jgi:hypothetical protein
MRRSWGLVLQICRWVCMAVWLALLARGIWEIATPSTRLWTKVLVLLVMAVNVILIGIYRSRDEEKIAANVGRNDGNS